jgi:hypothetical protein
VPWKYRTWYLPKRTLRYPYNKVQGPPIIVGWTMMVSTTPAWRMEPTTSLLGAMSPYHQPSFMIIWIIFKNHLLEVGLTTKPRDHGTPNTCIRWFILFYHMWRPRMNRNSLKMHLVPHEFGGVLGTGAFGHFFFFFCAVTIPWSRLLARVWSGPE